jgi:hypothetical protein
MLPGEKEMCNNPRVNTSKRENKGHMVIYLDDESKDDNE